MRCAALGRDADLAASRLGVPEYIMDGKVAQHVSRWVKLVGNDMC